MLTIKKHLNAFPTMRFSCSRCGCEFLTDEYVMRTVNEWHPENNKMIVVTNTVAMMTCPECGNVIVREEK